MSSSVNQVKLARDICRPNVVRNLMLENKLAHSFGIRIAFSTEMPLVAKRAGYSAVLTNLEHMAMSIETMKDIAVSCLNVGFVLFPFFYCLPLKSCAETRRANNVYTASLQWS